MNPEGLFLGRFHLSRNALSARAKERFRPKKCSVCSGRGVSKSEEIAVKIPPGIRDGEAISLPGLGEAVVGGRGWRPLREVHCRQTSRFQKRRLESHYGFRC